MGRKEIADQLLLQIQTIIDVYEHNFGRKPNHLTLGVKLWACLSTYIPYLTVYQTGDHEEMSLYGIPVTLDYDRHYIIAPGVACNYTIPEPDEEVEKPKFIVQTLWSKEESHERESKT